MPKTLLLADDSVTIQKVVGITFANEDVDLITVDNGDDALRRVRETPPDCVLADISMPGLNGYELCRALKADPRLASIPVVLLTGTFESFDTARAAEVGADAHIAKPFEAQALIDQVSALLAAPRRPAPTEEPAELRFETPLPAAEPHFDPRRARPREELRYEASDLDDLGASAPTRVLMPRSEAGAPSRFEDSGEDSHSGYIDPLSASGSAAPTGAGDEPSDDSLEASSFLDPLRPVAASPERAAPAPPPPFRHRPPAEDDSFSNLPPPRPTPPPLWDTGFSSPPDTTGSARGRVEPEPSEPGDGAEIAMTTEDELPWIEPEPLSFEEVESDEVSAVTEPIQLGTSGAAGEPDALPDAAGEPFLGEPFVGESDSAGQELAPDAFGVEPLELADDLRDVGAAEAEPDFASRLDEDPARDEPLESLWIEETPESPAEEAPPPRPSVREQPAPLAAPAIDSRALAENLEKVAWEAFGGLSEQVVREIVKKVEEIAWEVIPRLAESLIRDEIERLKAAEPED